jgi:two-component system, OmpR family, response regulator MtrA
MTRPPLIMVVDDSPEIIKLITDILKLEGFEVVPASDGKTGLELFEQQKPDLILLDIMMPGEYNGLDVLYYVRERSSVPIIMLTAYSHPASIRKALEDGADDYITKPFSAQVLVARIQAKLRRTGTEV